MKRKRLMIGYAAIVLSIAFLLIQGGRGTRPVRAIELPAMTDLNNLEPLKQAFQRDRGKVRLWR